MSELQLRAILAAIIYAQGHQTPAEAAEAAEAAEELLLASVRKMTGQRPAKGGMDRAS